MKAKERKVTVGKYCAVCALVVSLIVFLSGYALATSKLGVATGTHMYAYTDPDPEYNAYIEYFTVEQGGAIFPALGEYEGFVIGASGDTLTVFTSYNPSNTQIYLMANTGGHNLPMSFGVDESTGDPLYLTDATGFVDGKAAGYNDTPYAYLAPSQNLTDWTTQAFEPSKTFYLCTAAFEYTDTWSPGYYMWAAADINGTPGLQYTGEKGTHDKFSPKTTSAGGYPIPEPATMLLLGTGLIGLACLGRKKFRR